MINSIKSSYCAVFILALFHIDVCLDSINLIQSASCEFSISNTVHECCANNYLICIPLMCWNPTHQQKNDHLFKTRSNSFPFLARSLSISKELELASNSSAHFHTQQYCFKLQGCDNIVLVIWNIPTDSCGAHYVLPIRKVIIARKMAQISLPFVMQTKAYFVHEPAYGCLFALFLSLRLFLLMLPSSFLLYFVLALSFAISLRRSHSLLNEKNP